jgi:hypothetical protein
MEFKIIHLLDLQVAKQIQQSEIFLQHPWKEIKTLLRLQLQQMLFYIIWSET